MPKQFELFSENDIDDSSYKRIEAMSSETRKVYVEIVSFIYYGVKNCKDPEKLASRYTLKANIGKEKFLWYNKVMEWLNDEGFINYSGDRVSLKEFDDLDSMKTILDKYSKTHLEPIRQYATNDPLNLLKNLTKQLYVGSVTQTRRNSKILRPYDADTTESWAFCVPKCFNEALDIKLSENNFNTVPFAIWTQGSCFAFQRADVIYDKPKDKPWRHRIFIESASPAMPPEFELKDEGKEKRKIVKVNPGNVTFRLHVANNDGITFQSKEPISMTQADFVRYLITGIEAGCSDPQEAI